MKWYTVCDILREDYIINKKCWSDPLFIKNNEDETPTQLIPSSLIERTQKSPSHIVYTLNLNEIDGYIINKLWVIIVKFIWRTNYNRF